ncbi:MAG: hypothetical protein QGI33_02220 [Candidatus Brocadiia bacterium]|jgi:hypothetical protein|nr:hypothetical protein [Candidatus Brocadiia bacterium]
MWQAFADSIAGVLSGDRALQQACEQYRTECFSTFPNFEQPADRCAEQLELAGLCDGEAVWSGWRTMKAWDIERARLWMVAPHRELLADWSVKPQCLAMYSRPSELEADIVEWNGEDGVDLAGKKAHADRKRGVVHVER